MKYLRNERGFALAVAIFALVVIGTLVAGSMFVGVQEHRVGQNTVKLQQAMAAAEQGAESQVASWNREFYNTLSVGSGASFNGTLAGGAGWYRGTVTRLSRLNYLLTSEGFSADNAARQQVGVLLRLRPVEFLVQAALETQGVLKIGGSSQISGYDDYPPGWTGCDTLFDGLPGIRLPETDSIQLVGGCAGLSCVDGTVKVEEDPTISSGSLTTFGDLNIMELRTLANKFTPAGTQQIRPTVSGGACNTADARNWGSPSNPTGPCGNYFPVIWVEGDLLINGDEGQGVLIVNGNLDVQGGFDFFGPVIVNGTLGTAGTGGHFNGGVLAANIRLEQNDVLGNAVIQFSSCALARAAEQSAPAFTMKERSWANLW